MGKVALILLVSVLFDGQLVAAQQRQPIDPAQSEMHTRISHRTEAYARQIGISERYVYRCFQEMHLKTYAHPRNGYIPFAYYNGIGDQKMLDFVVSTREGYETTFIVLCLARAKKALEDAH